MYFSALLCFLLSVSVAFSSMGADSKGSGGGLGKVWMDDFPNIVEMSSGEEVGGKPKPTTPAPVVGGPETEKPAPEEASKPDTVDPSPDSKATGGSEIDIENVEGEKKVGAIGGEAPKIESEVNTPSEGKQEEELELTEKSVHGDDGKPTEISDTTEKPREGDDGDNDDEEPEENLEEVQEAANKLCETKTGQMIQHPRNTCSPKFFLCSSEEGAVERNCENPKEEAYSEFTRQCVPRSVLPTCKVKTTVNCEELKEGNHPIADYEHGCSAFFVTCVHQMGLKRRCASPMTRFDSESDRCLFSDYVLDCGGEPTAMPGKEKDSEPDTPKKSTKESEETEKKEAEESGDSDSEVGGSVTTEPDGNRRKRFGARRSPVLSWFW